MPVVAFLDVVLTPCAKTPELIVAVKSIIAAATIVPDISSFVLVSFVFFVVVIAIIP
jgi:hypothetical protein